MSSTGGGTVYLVHATKPDDAGAIEIVFTTEPDTCSSLDFGGCRDVAYTFDVYVMNADGTGIRDITSAPQFEARPAWGPADG